MTTRVLWKAFCFAAIMGGGASAFGQSGDVPPPYPSVNPVSAVVPQVPAPAPAVTPTPATPPMVPVVPPPVTGSAPSVPVLPPSTTTPSPAIPQVPVVSTPSELPKTVTPTIPVVTTPPIATPMVPPVTTPVTPPPTVTPVVKTEPAKPSTVKIKIGSTPSMQTELAKLTTAVNESKQTYDKLNDYSCHFIVADGSGKTERIYELHARTKPHSVYMKLVEPKAVAGWELCFISGKFAVPQARVKPAGGTFVGLPITDSQAKVGKHTCDRVGLAAVLDMISQQIATETKLGNPMNVAVQDYTYAGKAVTRYELTCERSHAYRTSYRTVLFIDKETKLPIRFEAYDEPKRGMAEMIDCLSFVNLKTNVGHSTGIFER